MPSEPQVDFAVPSYLHDLVVPALAREARVGAPTIRAWTLAPDALNRAIAEARVDGALTLGFEPTAPSTWRRAHVATLRSTLFGSPRVADRLGPTPRVSDVLTHRFVGAVHGGDRCPVPAGERAIGHEVESMQQACALAVETNELVYGPELAAEPFLADGRLVEVPLLGWSRFEQVQLAFDPPAFAGFDDVVETIRAALSRRSPKSAIVPAAAIAKSAGASQR